MQIRGRSSLRSKRFRRAFLPLEAFFAFWLRKKLGRAQHWWKQRPEKRKVHRTCGKPYRSACYAGYTWSAQTAACRPTLVWPSGPGIRLWAPERPWEQVKLKMAVVVSEKDEVRRETHLSGWTDGSTSQLGDRLNLIYLVQTHNWLVWGGFVWNRETTII